MSNITHFDKDELALDQDAIKAHAEAFVRRMEEENPGWAKPRNIFETLAEIDRKLTAEENRTNS